MNRFPLRIFVLLLLLLLCAFSMTLPARHEPQQQDVVQGKAAQIVIGKSTWKDVERVFGAAYLINEPRKKRQQRVWYMAYPMREEYQADVIFAINRKTGVVEERFWGLREPKLVRRLVTEFHAPYCFKDQPWAKPKYKGIAVGESKRADVEERFGTPDRVEDCAVEGRKSAALYYSKLSNFDGEVMFAVDCRTGTVGAVWLQPRESIALGEVLNTYGADYCYVRYFLREDPEDPEVGIPRQDPRGNVVGIHYPSLGVVLVPDSWDKIHRILYSVNSPEPKGR